MRKIFVFAAFLIIIFSSCRGVMGKRIRGNGTIKTENITSGQFSNIDVSGAVDVYIKQDSVSSVKLETDENLLEYIEITDEGQTLHIEQVNGVTLRPSKSIKVYITNPSFQNINVSGACEIFGADNIQHPEAITIKMSGASSAKLDLKTPKVTVDLSGASKITLKGQTKDFMAEGSGASSIKGYDLMAENTFVKLSGASNADVFASVKLDAHVSGASDLDYKGNPAVTKEVSGASSAKKAE